MRAPTNLRELVSHLQAFPQVYAHHPTNACASGLRYFDGFERGGLWFFDPDTGLRSYAPIECGHVSAETGLDFTGDGFGVTKFGVRVSFRYVQAKPIDQTEARSLIEE